MSDINTADNISRWVGLGIELPAELAGLIEIFEVLRWTEVGYQPVFDLRAVTAQNAETKIREFAGELALAGPVLEKAKREAVDLAARNVINVANGAVADAIKQLTPEFIKHVEAYVDAVEQLPDVINSDALLSAGPDAVKAYEAARQEAGYLDRISGWVANTRELSMHSGDPDPVLRILRPSSVNQLFKLDAAFGVPADRILHAINPLYLTAVREGVEFGINTVKGCAALRSKLTNIAQPAFL